MNDMSLQGSLQQAVRKISRVQQVAEAVIAAAGDQYLRCSELILKPQVYPLVKDANALSCILSEAYSRNKLVGRVHAPFGKEKFAYGARSDLAVAPGIKPKRRGVIQAVEPEVLGYEVSIWCNDPREALRMLERNPGARHEKIAGGNEWRVFIRVADKAAALDALLASDLLILGTTVNPVLDK
jgi:hypothetical protein